MKNLVIVESPTKARTIGRFLGKDYEIRPSMGHIMDLPKSKLGVDVEKNFTPEYDVIPDKKKIIAELKTLAKNADTILLATDPDREGEAISSDVQHMLTDGKSKITASKFKRIVFHEITEEAIKEALSHPRDVDKNLVHAQTARRVLDRLVGYQLSPLLWKKVRRGLSAGRVQSVALRLIVEREREIEKFSKEPYWTIHGLFSNNNTGHPGATLSGAIGSDKQPSGDSIASLQNDKNSTEFSLIEINKEKIEQQQAHDLYDGTYTITKTIIDSQDKADKIVADIKEKQFTVADVVTRESKRSPYPPFTTSTLQQEASRRFGFPGKRTMSLAQKLYEEGFITYHRTDSVSLSPVAVKQMRSYIEKEFGEKYMPAEPRLYFTKQKNAQEAHEAIRPTHITRLSPAIKADLGEAYAKLYELIWKRALASQMSDALIEATTVYVDSLGSHPGEAATSIGSKTQAKGDSIVASQPLQNDKDSEYRFKATGSVLLFEGFLKLTPQALEDRRLAKFESGEMVACQGVRADEHETAPPPRYNDASLIKTLEEKSIGRPSTYAAIIGTLTDRTYVEREERRFIPTTIGSAVNDFLVTNFSTVDDVPFTAQMEDNLDLVANGEKEWKTMMKEFYAPFKKKLKEVEGAERVKIEVEETGEQCPLCTEGKLVIRTGKFGKFFSCSRFPDCRFTKPYAEETDVLCPKDGGKVIIKKTRKGRKFYGCSNYPSCDFAVWKLEDITNAKPATTTSA